MDIRKVILDALKRSGRSRYWLGETVHEHKGKDGEPVANPETIYRYLRGDRDTSGEVIGAIFDALRITTVAEPLPTEAPKQKPRRKR